MEAERRAKMNKLETKKTRKALSDCTNTNTNINSSQSSTSSSLIKPSKPSLSSTPKKLLKNITTGSTHNYQNATTNPNSSVSTPPRPQKSASATAGNGGGGAEVLEPSVYTRRQTPDKRKDKDKDKDKVVAEPLSFSPAAPARIPTFRNKINEDGDISLSKSCTVPRKKKSNLSSDKIMEDGDISQSKSCVVPNKKKQRRIPPGQDDSKYSLPQDFVEQQRAYFKEIDEFELPEEEVASGDELE